MASLQTLRNKGGVIVAIVIALALVSFLVGDLFTSRSVFFGGPTAGEIDGTDVTAQQYTERVNYLTTINEISTGNQAVSKEQSDAISAQAWETFVRELAFLPAAKELGLITTAKELEQLFFGENPSPIIRQIFVDPQTGAFNPAMVKELQSNLSQDQTGQMSIFWNYLQSEVGDMSVVNKFRTLTTKASYTTAAMAKTLAALQENTYNIDFVFQPFTSIADSTIKINDADLKKYYDTHKASFKIGENRTLSYVLFETLPSNDDHKAAAQYIDGLVADFAAAADPMQFARANTQGQTSERFYSRNELTTELADYAFSGANTVYGPILNGETYTIAKISAAKTLADSLDLSLIFLRPDQQKLADSLKQALATGADFATLASQHSLDQQSAMLGGAVGPVDPQTLSPEFSAQILGAAAGEIKLITAPQSLSIVKINKIIGGQPRVQLAMINYTVEPSETTRNRVYNRATTFALAAQGSLENYNKAVNDSALIARTTVIAPNQREIQGLKESQSLVGWAYNLADKEKVSEVESYGDTFVVAALMEAAKKGYQPLDKVKEQVKQAVVSEKKAELISAKFKEATSLSSIASSLADTVQRAADINFNTFVIPQVGAEPALVGAVCALKEGAISKPITGFKGVFAAQATAIIKNPVSLDVEKQRITAENEQTAFARAYQAFLDMVDIKDNRYTLY